VISKILLILAHCLDLYLNDKRPGATSDNGFIFLKMNKNENIKEKKNPVGGFGGLHYQGMANPANQPISGKIAKMALFNRCM
jgi:hypothetical protein